MLIEERAGRRILVDEQGIELRPGEATAYDGEVYYLGWVDGDRAAPVGDARFVPNERVPPSHRPLVALLARPERLSRPDTAGNDRRPPSTFPEFARRMEVILRDIVELTGSAHDAIGTERLVSDLVCSIGTRIFDARDLLRNYEGAARGAAAPSTEAPVPSAA